MLLGAIIGITSALGLWLIGVPFFYVLALISGVGELIPVVGPILSAIPAVAVASSISLKTALLVIAFFVVQQQFANHVLVPVLGDHYGALLARGELTLAFDPAARQFRVQPLSVPQLNLTVLFSELTAKPD
jgi:hypothetical protein